MKKYFLTIIVRCLVVVDAILALLFAMLCLENVAKRLTKKLFKENYAEIGISFPNKD